MSCRKWKRISCHVLLGVVLSKRLAMPSQRVIHRYILNCNMILVLSSVVCVCVCVNGNHFLPGGHSGSVIAD